MADRFLLSYDASPCLSLSSIKTMLAAHVRAFKNTWQVLRADNTQQKGRRDRSKSFHTHGKRDRSFINQKKRH